MRKVTSADRVKMSGPDEYFAQIDTSESIYAVAHGCTKEQADDRRQEIVRAVNAHDGLVNALKDAWEHITILGGGCKPPLSNGEMRERLSAALKAAGVE